MKLAIFIKLFVVRGWLLQTEALKMGCRAKRIFWMSHRGIFVSINTYKILRTSAFLNVMPGAWIDGLLLFLDMLSVVGFAIDSLGTQEFPQFPPTFLKCYFQLTERYCSVMTRASSSGHNRSQRTRLAKGEVSKRSMSKPLVFAITSCAHIGEDERLQMTSWLN